VHQVGRQADGCGTDNQAAGEDHESE
jgi:hypothetical protein